MSVTLCNFNKFSLKSYKTTDTSHFLSRCLQHKHKNPAEPEWPAKYSYVRVRKLVDDLKTKFVCLPHCCPLRAESCAAGAPSSVKIVRLPQN